MPADTVAGFRRHEGLAAETVAYSVGASTGVEHGIVDQLSGRGSERRPIATSERAPPR